MKTPLIKEFRYHVTIDKVWKALTEIEQMQKWYFPQIRKFQPIVGFVFQFNDDGSKYQKEWVVTTIEEEETFAHTWAYKGYPGKSEVTFHLLTNEDETRLTVTQTGLESFPDQPHFKRERFESGWDNLLGDNLRKLLENKSLL